MIPPRPRVERGPPAPHAGGMSGEGYHADGGTQREKRAGRTDAPEVTHNRNNRGVLPPVPHAPARAPPRSHATNV
jgi:hypothetical protein